MIIIQEIKTSIDLQIAIYNKFKLILTLKNKDIYKKD